MIDWCLMYFGVSLLGYVLAFSIGVAQGMEAMKNE